MDFNLTSSTDLPTVPDSTNGNSTSIAYYHIPTFPLTVRSLILLSATVGNIFVLRALHTLRHSWKESFTFMLNVCIYDLLIGAVFIPTSMMTRNLYGYTAWVRRYCFLQGIIEAFLNIVEPCGIFFFALDRAIFIRAPLRYYNIVTPKFSKTLTITAAVVVLCYSTYLYKDFDMPENEVCISSLYVPKLPLILAFATILIIALCTTLLHGIVAVTAYRQSHAVKRNGVAPSAFSRSVQNSNSTTHQHVNGHDASENYLGDKDDQLENKTQQISRNTCNFPGSSDSSTSDVTIEYAKNGEDGENITESKYYCPMHRGGLTLWALGQCPGAHHQRGPTKLSKTTLISKDL